MPRQAHHSRRRNKRGTTSRQTGTALTDLIRTVSEVGRVWPTPDQILPGATLEALPDPAKWKVLTVFVRGQKLAYKCLRWARWMSDRRHLHVRCIHCHKTAWSYSAVKQRDPKTGAYRVDEGKRRWECPRETVGNAAGKATDGSPQSSRQKGCGKKFCDTSGTPFANARVPIGLVFAALYYPDGTIERLLEAVGRQNDVLAIQKILKGLARRQHKNLQSRLQQYARLFCGKMLFTHCSKLTDPFGGRALVDGRVLIELANIRLLSKVSELRWTSVKSKYQLVRTVLGQIKRLDRSLIHGAPLDRGYRRKLVNELQCAVRALTAPPTEH